MLRTSANGALRQVRWPDDDHPHDSVQVHVFDSVWDNPMVIAIQCLAIHMTAPGATTAPSHALALDAAGFSGFPPPPPIAPLPAVHRTLVPTPSADPNSNRTPSPISGAEQPRGRSQPNDSSSRHHRRRRHHSSSDSSSSSSSSNRISSAYIKIGGFKTPKNSSVHFNWARPDFYVSLITTCANTPGDCADKWLVNIKSYSETLPNKLSEAGTTILRQQQELFQNWLRSIPQTPGAPRSYRDISEATWTVARGILSQITMQFGIGIAGSTGATQVQQILDEQADKSYFFLGRLLTKLTKEAAKIVPSRKRSRSPRGDASRRGGGDDGRTNRTVYASQNQNAKNKQFFRKRRS